MIGLEDRRKLIELRQHVRSWQTLPMTCFTAQYPHLPPTTAMVPAFYMVI
jgi:hypothetical protein